LYWAREKSAIFLMQERLSITSDIFGMLLAIDTSTALTGIACYDHSGLLGECTWQSRRNHTAQVLPQLQLLLRHLERDRNGLQAVAVALGPGSWSGLRVGMSIAKGLALAGDLTLLGIGTLDALAYQYQSTSMPVYPLIRLGRDRFATAEFQNRKGVQRVGDYRNLALADLCAEITGRAFFCGDIDPDVQDWLKQHLGTQAHFPQVAARLRRAGYLADLAWQRFCRGERDDLASLEPIYLGEPVKSKI
jgi:tRNA threonylcarbamoyladenosine biosynthesis protein TsaB